MFWMVVTHGVPKLLKVTVFSDHGEPELIRFTLNRPFTPPVTEFTKKFSVAFCTPLPVVPLGRLETKSNFKRAYWPPPTLRLVAVPKFATLALLFALLMYVSPSFRPTAANARPW